MLRIAPTGRSPGTLFVSLCFEPLLYLCWAKSKGYPLQHYPMRTTDFHSKHDMQTSSHRGREAAIKHSKCKVTLSLYQHPLLFFTPLAANHFREKGEIFCLAYFYMALHVVITGGYGGHNLAYRISTSIKSNKQKEHMQFYDLRT